MHTHVPAIYSGVIWAGPIERKEVECASSIDVCVCVYVSEYVCHTLHEFKRSYGREGGATSRRGNGEHVTLARVQVDQSSHKTCSVRRFAVIHFNLLYLKRLKRSLIAINISLNDTV